MTLVERFIEFDRWPVCRKTALLCGIGLLLQVPNAFLVSALPARLAWLDGTFAFSLAWGLVAALILPLILSLLAMWRGWQGRWTAPVLILPYGFLIAVAVWGWGGISTSMASMVPTLVLLVALWYGVGWGAWTLLYALCLTFCVGYLPATGRVAFAPFLRDRTLDSQNDVLFVSLVGWLWLGVFLFCFGLVVLVLLARRMQEARLDRSARVIRRYIPSQLADRIIKGENVESARPERSKLTIFFSDLVGFAEISEELEPEDLSHVLNEYFTEMTAIAHRQGGTVDELSGDAILIFFGAPNATDDRDHALRAVRMATDMQAATRRLNEKWKAAGIPAVFQVRMGISTGVVTVGHFGSPDRMKYAALGKHVNLAARLQSRCEPGRVLMSHATWLLIGDQIACVPKGELQLKGIHKPVMAYELGPEGISPLAAGT